MIGRKPEQNDVDGFYGAHDLIDVNLTLKTWENLPKKS